MIAADALVEAVAPEKAWEQYVESWKATVQALASLAMEIKPMGER